MIREVVTISGAMTDYLELFDRLHYAASKQGADIDRDLYWWTVDGRIVQADLYNGRWTVDGITVDDAAVVAMLEGRR